MPLQTSRQLRHGPSGVTSAFCGLALAMTAAAAQATPTAIESSGSLSTYAQYVLTEPLQSQSNLFVPADPLTPFSVSVEAVSTNIVNTSVELRSSASLSASWVSAAQGTVDLATRWSASNITNGRVSFFRDPALEGWGYTVRTDVDSVFTTDFTLQFDAGSTTQSGMAGFGLYVDQAFVDQTYLAPAGRLQLALPAGQTYQILLRPLGGFIGRLGNDHTGISAHFDWNITSAVPEPGSGALLACGLLAVGATAQRRRASMRPRQVARGALRAPGV